MSPPAPHLVDEILEEIFLRLRTPAALARASTASPRFRRIITTAPSSAATESATRRRSWASPTKVASTQPRRPIPPPRSPVPSRPPPISPTPSSQAQQGALDTVRRPRRPRPSRGGQPSLGKIQDPRGVRSTFPAPRESFKEWQLKNIIPLPGQYDYFMLGAAEGFLFLGATTEDQLDVEDNSLVCLTDWDVDYFSLDVKTSELTKICKTKKQYFDYDDVYWYFGFPPSLSKPSV